jgi:glycerophosphoryl diester phosphodiesterase
VTPLPNAHSHNDYEQTRPLLEALDHGFCSVEADIFLVDDRLCVAHESSQIRPERTLQALYLDPLLARVRQNHGHVYSADTRFHLLIDIKSDGLATYQALDRLLQNYADMLTRHENDQTITNAVSITISGNRPRDFLAAQSTRYAAYDGRLADLDSNASPALIPLVSDNWRAHFQWRGQGPFPEPERMKLRELVRRAHEQGRTIRFWGNPDEAAGWAALRDAGVDLINTDHIAKLRDFLLSP